MEESSALSPLSIEDDDSAGKTNERSFETDSDCSSGPYDTGRSSDNESHEGIHDGNHPSSSSGHQSVSSPCSSEAADECIAEDGSRFSLPATKNMFELLMNPCNWTLPEMLVVGAIFAELYAALFLSVPRWVFLTIFVFWRLCYNLGLGYILNRQSTERFLTMDIERLLSPKYRGEDTLSRMMMRICIYASMGRAYWREPRQSCVTAWLMFRHLVSLVLANDGVTYIIFALKYFEAPTHFGTIQIMCYVLGVFLCAFNYWAKADAHRVIGDFAWYWGDFFFRMDKTLVFDGVFQMFPHPMYTVGYSVYYGISLLTRSYTVLFVSVAAHVSQLAFLAFVEEPHIQRTYGTDDSAHVAVISRTELYRAGFFRKNREPLMFKNLDLLRAADLSLLLIVSQAVLLSAMGFRPWFYIGQVLLWRVVHTVGMCIVLSRESKDHWWTRHFMARGYTKQESFDNWKRVYNISLTMNMVAFFICGLKLATMPSSWLSARYAAQIVGGLVLIALNVWSCQSIHSVLGDFGWFYGDFFIDEEQPVLLYTGIYRYFNNPDVLIGYAAFYGVSLMSCSWTVLWLAVFSQLCHFLFLRYVETPHIKKHYHSQIIRRDGGLSSGIKVNLQKAANLPPVKKLTGRVSKHAARVRTNLKHHVSNEIQNVRTEIQQIKMNLKDRAIDKLAVKVRAARRRAKEKSLVQVTEVKAMLERAERLVVRVRESPFPKEAEELVIKVTRDASRHLKAQVQRVELVSKRLASRVQEQFESDVYQLDTGAATDLMQQRSTAAFEDVPALDDPSSMSDCMTDHVKCE